MSMRHYDFAEIPFCNVKRERLLLKKKYDTPYCGCYKNITLKNSTQ